MADSEASPYVMTINLSVLHHLGIGLYSNIPAVLSEVVANAWDADAELVEITIDTEKDEIVIKDDGSGMNLTDINKKFLHVGYEKRKSESVVTPKGRHVMGRKGIGKLSVFSIAQLVDVHSIKEGEIHAFRMDLNKIENLIKDGKSHDYRPDPLDLENIEIEKGTHLILRNFKKKLNKAESYLRRRIARRFSIFGPEHDFIVEINEEEITAKDRDYFNRLEYMWCFGGEGKAVSKDCKSLEKAFELDNLVHKFIDEDGIEREYKVSGWIGTVDERKHIDDANNTIVLFAHGKLIQEDIIKDLNEGGIYSKYLIGEIDADFMDLDELEDMVTSDRQRVREDDERYNRIKEFVWNALKEIQKRWTELRKESGAEKALENPVIKEWYDKLTGDNKKWARMVFGKIESLTVPDLEAKKELYKASMLGFESMALKNSLSVLNTIEKIESEEELRSVMGLFGSIDELEAAYYYQISKGRLQVIRNFAKMVPISKEKAVQDYIFDHLWLLDASWDRAASNKHMEESVKTEFKKIDAGLTEEEASGRIDIRYQTAAGKHIIIELKKYDRKVEVFELSKQINKYVCALEKCLTEKFPEKDSHIEAICILGSPPTGGPPEMINDNLASVKARYKTYDTLISTAMENYGNYLEEDKKVSKLISIIERLDETFKEVE